MPKKPEKKTEPRANAKERDPRFEAFAKLLVAGGEYEGKHFSPGNTMRAAIAAGYDAQYAKHHGHLLLARLRLRAQPVLKAVGVDEFYVARKIKQLMGAKTLRYNPGTKQMMTMGNGQVQLGAAALATKILGMEAPTIVKGDGPGGAHVVNLVTSVRLPDRSTAGAKSTR